jgi:hypothetical protein
VEGLKTSFNTFGLSEGNERVANVVYREGIAPLEISALITLKLMRAMSFEYHQTPFGLY